jgi:hypothetical protein
MKIKQHNWRQQKSKAITVKGCLGLLVCHMSRIPHCLDNRFTDGSEVARVKRRPCSTT